MSRWQGKSRGNALGYGIFVFILRRLGLRPAYFVLLFVASYFLLFSRQSSRVIYRYLRDRLGFGAFKARLGIFRNYYVFGQSLIDKIVILSGIRHPFTFEFDGEHNLQQIAAGGRGGILLSAHMGNWEAAGFFLNRLETRIHVVMFDGEQARIKDYLEQVTGGRNFNVIVIREDMSHVYAIGEALQKNELICLHADRFLEGNKTQRLPFLGAEAAFPEGPFLMAAAFNVPVSIVFAFKEGSFHYHLYGSEPIQRAAGESRGDFSRRLTSAFIGQMEEKARRYPTQWFNYYDFWALN